MKRVIALVLAAITLLAFVSCTGGKVYDAKEKVFKKDNFEITLTERFKESEAEGFTIAYESKDVVVAALNEKFTLLEGLGDMGIKAYAELVRTQNILKSPSEVTVDGDIASFEHTYKDNDEGVTYKYYSVMIKGEDGFWLVQFVCNTEKYEEHKPYFVEWAKSIKA